MPERVLDLTGGTALVVTDLHGDRDAFDRCLAHFGALYRRGAAQRLVLLGDLIHGSGPPQSDSSLDMLLDVIALRERLGPDTVIMLLGNHEMPHIYGVSLSRGDVHFTPPFERALGPHRARVFEFLTSLPLVIRTAAGVLLTHAGPAAGCAEQVAALRTFDHAAILAEADAVLAEADDLAPLYRQYEAAFGMSYAQASRYLLAVDGPDDPRYPHLLRSVLVAHRDSRFALLWDMLFTQNESGQSKAAYEQVCRKFLAGFSGDAPAPQRVIVSGHIVTPTGGHTLVNAYHLRVASAAHARPRTAGEYLLLNCAEPVESAGDLLGGLRPVFDSPDLPA